MNKEIFTYEYIYIVFFACPQHSFSQEKKNHNCSFFLFIMELPLLNTNAQSNSVLARGTIHFYLVACTNSSYIHTFPSLSIHKVFAQPFYVIFFYNCFYRIAYRMSYPQTVTTLSQSCCDNH